MATDSRVMTRAAAPSEMDEALAAVMVPSAAKAGRRVGIFAGSALGGCSSVEITSTPLRPLTLTGTISRSKPPDAWAARAREREVMA